MQIDITNMLCCQMILMVPPPENWKRPPGRPCIMWLNTVQCNLRAYNLTLNEAVDLAQNRPLSVDAAPEGTHTPD